MILVAVAVLLVAAVVVVVVVSGRLFFLPSCRAFTPFIGGWGAGLGALLARRGYAPVTRTYYLTHPLCRVRQDEVDVDSIYIHSSYTMLFIRGIFL